MRTCKVNQGAQALAEWLSCIESFKATTKQEKGELDDLIKMEQRLRAQARSKRAQWG